MRHLASEFRQALRRLGRAPIFATAAVLTLTLALGANATIFAIVHRVVLNPLPYPDSDRLLSLDHGSAVLHLSSGIGMTSGLYYQYQRARTLDSVAIVRDGESTIISGGEPERIDVESATATLPQVLRVRPAIGRWFSEQEAAVGGPAVAVLSHGLWVRRFGQSPAILGRSIVLDGVATQVIGIMAPAFAFSNPRIDAWVPARVSRAMGFNVPFGYDGVARLRDAMTVDDARTELNGLITDLPNVYRGDQSVLANMERGGLRSVAVPLKDVTVGSIARSLWILLAAMGLLLVVACANIANLCLVRANARDREVAVRRAVGAGAARIAGLFLAESAMLASGGALGGIAVAWGTLRALVAYGPALPRLQEIQLDESTVVFTAALSVIVAIACGATALRRTGSIVEGLHEAARGQTATRQRQRMRQLLMGGQVATALVLIVAAMLMLQSFRRLRVIDLGFNPASALTFRLGLPLRDYPSRAAAVTAHRTILQRLAELPGVEAVSASTGLPLVDACFGNTVLVRGRSVQSGTVPPFARICAVSEGFVTAMQMRLVDGRDLARADVDAGRPNVLVNQAFVKSGLGGDEAIGQQLRSNAPPPAGAQRNNGAFVWDGAPPWLTIVGVVSNTPNQSLTETTPVPTIYMPMSLAGGPDIPAKAMLGPPISAMTYVVRSRVPIAALTPAVYGAVQAADRTLALAQVQPLQRIVDGGFTQMAFTMTLLLIAAGVALGIGLVGIYGVVAFVVSQRRNEIGVRLALGAAPQAVVAMIVRQGAAVTFAGIAAGIAIALAGSRVLASLLYGVGPRDPAVFAGASTTLFTVAIAACWLPARRAATVSPTEALRAD
ncbi:MAG TPA: ABC transporter permease [Vicinamibacterales bacterium]|nr:ABC transporter permease [Vicinamibacterales bacterium]